MAYNILKDDVEFSGVNLGTIEDMVDDHRDQTIGGVKTFSDMITASAGLSASVYYGDGSGLSGINSSPGGGEGSIQFNSSSTLAGNLNFTYDGSNVSLVGELSASFLSGSGENIYNITSANINGNINANQINFGDGLENNSNELRVKIDANSAINRAATGIKVDLTGLSASGVLADADVFLVEKTGNKKATALGLYNYVNGKLTIPTVAGLNTQIQYNDAGDLGASPNLTFNDTTNTLTTTNITASTHVSASVFYGDGSNLTGISGGSSTSFTIFSSSFTISSSYDVLGVNTSGSVVTGSLLAANSYSAGQRLVFKDIAGSASVNNIVVEVSGTQQLDGVSGASLKITANNGSATIVSDGVSNFYIIGTN